MKSLLSSAILLLFIFLAAPGLFGAMPENKGEDFTSTCQILCTDHSVLFLDSASECHESEALPEELRETLVKYPKAVSVWRWKDMIIYAVCPKEADSLLAILHNRKWNCHSVKNIECNNFRIDEAGTLFLMNVEFSFTFAHAGQYCVQQIWKCPLKDIPQGKWEVSDTNSSNVYRKGVILVNCGNAFYCMNDNANIEFSLPVNVKQGVEKQEPLKSEFAFMSSNGKRTAFSPASDMEGTFDQILHAGLREKGEGFEAFFKTKVTVDETGRTKYFIYHTEDSGETWNQVFKNTFKDENPLAFFPALRTSKEK